MPASSAEAAMSTVKPVSPSLDFRIPDRRSSSSITRRRNDGPPARVWRTQVPPQGRPKFNTVLGGYREARTPSIWVISQGYNEAWLLDDRARSVKTALKDPREAIGDDVLGRSETM